MEKQCLLETTGKTAVITINRPPMNTLSRDTIQELDAILTEIEAIDSIGAVILTGTGDKMFSAGADVSEFGDFSDREKAKQAVQGIHEIFNRIESFPKPIIASVNGKALGGGNELQMACHLTIASEAAEFGLPEVRLGIIPGYGGTQRLPRLIGRRRALELALSGERISAEKALKYGLINKVAPQNELRNETLNWAKQLADGPPLAVKGIIESVVKGLEQPLQDGLSIELEHMLNVSRSEDAIEGVSAFFAKRKPEFKGR
ncbi:enoyl-CoA hydratase-related protein [Bacillus sp. CECT 9360]|uniref:enoyl-CoA hydratase/isomerase family protein n=1 Tax=Bacillus sp. CECT 9360 TaxID=2845821 RepID=UPI001E63C79F|nr:enoyl-CoA hydratase-related protein [Bacillus sp. CECT 9360]CAH0344044.1 Short-chain-enoyl-CoA hydratase [Bacillus sp. CECT 9360]